MERVLVTGGAGFIGSHIVDLLVEEGYDVRVFDNLAYQVHNGEIPAYLNPQAEYVVGDMRNRQQVKEAVEDVDIVSHQASAVGVGQSMYEISHYADVNVNGTANLLDVLVNEENHDVKKLVVASSMSNYGEGAYECEDCGEVHPQEREEERLKQQSWEQSCPHCDKKVKPKPTPESKPLQPTSIYAQTKRDQEEMSLLIGDTYGIDTTALRYFNVYGPRQSLQNPYTGVAAIFSSRIKNGNPPLVYEDGNQSRDFVYVEDVARANLLTLRNAVSENVLNVGNGTPVAIQKIAEVLIDAYGANLTPQIADQYRSGDIRHCFADIGRISEEVGFSPQTSFEGGINRLVAWAEEKDATDKFTSAEQELESRDIIK